MVDWTQVGPAVAAIAAIVYVVRTLKGMQADVLTFFGNHLSKVTKSLEDVSTNLSTLNERVDRLHDDNVESAAALHVAADRVASK